MGLEDCDSVLVSLGSGDIGISHLVSSVFISRENKLMPKPPADLLFHGLRKKLLAQTEVGPVWLHRPSDLY